MTPEQYDEAFAGLSQRPKKCYRIGGRLLTSFTELEEYFSAHHQLAAAKPFEAETGKQPKTPEPLNPRATGLAEIAALRRRAKELNLEIPKGTKVDEYRRLVEEAESKA